MPIGQNSPIDLVVFRANRLLCWHSKKHLRVQTAINGSAVYCGKCFRKRFAFTGEGESWYSKTTTQGSVDWVKKEL